MARQASVQSRWVRALPMGALGGAAGVLAGATITGFSGALAGEFILWLPLFFGGVCAAAGYLIGAVVIEGTADLMARLHMGGRIGTRAEHSRAQALAARGLYAQALAEYARAAADQPEDPEPLILGARLLRDQIGDPTAAADWLRRARQAGSTRAAHDITIARELAELYELKLGAPGLALPELARLAEKYPNTTAGAWARNRLGRLRNQVWETVKEPDRDPAPGDREPTG